MSNDSSNYEDEAASEPKKQMLPWGAIDAVVVAIGSYFVAQVLAVLVYQGVFSDIEFTEALVRTNSELFLLLGLISVFEFMIVYSYILLRGGTLKDLKLQQVRFIQLFKIIPAYIVYFVALLSITQISDLFLSEEIINQEQNIGFTSAQSSGELIVIFLALVVVAPVIEEIVFRGFMFQGLIRRFGGVGAAIISSGLFAVAHFQINVGIDTFVLGLASCWLLVQTKSIWPSIGLHAVKNAIAFTLLFVVSVSV